MIKVAMSKVYSTIALESCSRMAGLGHYQTSGSTGGQGSLAFDSNLLNSNILERSCVSKLSMPCYIS